MTSSTILLFDVDRTLVDTGGAGRRALGLALGELYPGGEAWLDFPLSGMTDRLIVGQALHRGGRGADPHEPVIEAYLARLERELIAAADRYVVYPGVVELLERAQGLEQVAVGLGTGNVERGARLKLQPGDLNRLFRFGGFGSDATERAEVLRIGATRGAALLQQPVEACRVVVIGDTPRDVEAALAIGAECLAVATGNYARETLLESGAHLAVEDLTAKEAAELLEA